RAGIGKQAAPLGRGVRSRVRTARALRRDRPASSATTLRAQAKDSQGAPMTASTNGNIEKAVAELVNAVTEMLAYLMREHLVRLTGERDGTAAADIRAICQALENARHFLPASPNTDAPVPPEVVH